MINESARYVCKKVAKKIGFFGRIAENLTFAAKITVYKSIILHPTSNAAKNRFEVWKLHSHQFHVERSKSIKCETKIAILHAEVCRSSTTNIS